MSFSFLPDFQASLIPFSLSASSMQTRQIHFPQPRLHVESNFVGVHLQRAWESGAAEMLGLGIRHPEISIGSLQAESDGDAEEQESEVDMQTDSEVYENDKGLAGGEGLHDMAELLAECNRQHHALEISLNRNGPQIGPLDFEEDREERPSEILFREKFPNLRLSTPALPPVVGTFSPPPPTRRVLRNTSQAYVPSRRPSPDAEFQSRRPTLLRQVSRTAETPTMRRISSLPTRKSAPAPTNGLLLHRQSDVNPRSPVPSSASTASGSSSLRLPVTGQQFKSAESFYNACKQGMKDLVGYPMWKQDTSRSKLVAACSKKKEGCTFKIIAIGREGAWTVFDADGTHSHPMARSVGEHGNGTDSSSGSEEDEDVTASKEEDEDDIASASDSEEGSAESSFEDETRVNSEDESSAQEETLRRGISRHQSSNSVPQGSKKSNADLLDDTPLSMKALIARQEAVFAEQRMRGSDENLQKQSKALVEADCRRIRNASTQSAQNSRMNGLVSFCKAKSIPVYPVTSSVVALCLHDRGLASMDGFVSGVERMRRISADMWKGKPMCELVGKRLTEDITLAGLCRSSRRKLSGGSARRVRASQTASLRGKDSSVEPFKTPLRRKRHIASLSPSPSPSAAFSSIDTPISIPSKRSRLFEPFADEDESPLLASSNKFTVEELSKFLSQLAPLLAPVSIAEALHFNGFDCRERLRSFVQMSDDVEVAEAFVKSEETGIKPLQRRMLIKKCQELKLRLCEDED